jgi:hypothetical protein
MDAHAVALGLALFGWVCIAACFLPVQGGPGAPARPWLSWVLVLFAIIFFLLGALFAFGWIRA